MLVTLLKDRGAQRAELVEFKEGFPVVYGELDSKRPDVKTLIVYSLYDVMPCDEDGWVVPPFSGEIVDAKEIDLPPDYGKCIVGRGARNQKGPLVAFLNAVKTMLEVEGDIPVNLIFTFDGEEEMGSPHFREFRDRYLGRLKRADRGT
jgi:acetylornithine deacetylase/succinyl-diaminopimelate desuccinylase-like protein